MMLEMLDPELCLPPHKVTHPEKYTILFMAFLYYGFSVASPALVGYPFGEKIQLITGSHRWAAANDAKIALPVIVYPLEVVKAVYGDLPKWELLIGR